MVPVSDYSRVKVLLTTVPFVLAILGGMVYLRVVGRELRSASLPLVQAAENIELEAATAHLWLEESLATNGEQSEGVEARLDIVRQQARFETAQTVIMSVSVLFAMLIGWLFLRLDRRRVAAIAALYRAERDARVAEAHHRTTFESMIDGLIVIDEHGSIESLNPAAARMFGYSAEEIVGQNVSELMPEPYRSEHDGYLRRYRDTGHSTLLGVNREVEGMRKDGTIFPMDLSANSMEVNGRQLFNGVIRDSTARKAAERQLQRTHAELEQFAYVASHDLQEPLRMVSSYIQLLEKKYSGALDEQADKYIHYAVDGAARMKVLIQDLLEFSRIGRKNLTLTNVETELILASVKADLAVSLEECQAVIDHDSLPEIYGNEGLIRSLFQNMLGNGIKYCSEQAPHIEVLARRKGRFWEFSIQDNGIGIEPEYFERIFGVFQRLHGQGEYEGTGIGLAICKKIVELHHGEISVESSPGKGSTFRFTLPAAHSGQSDQLLRPS